MWYMTSCLWENKANYLKKEERQKREGGGISVKSSSLYNSAALFQNFMRKFKIFDVG